MALLALVPPTAQLFRLIGSIQNAEFAMFLKAVWLCGIGTVSIFFVKRIKKAKALAALFYIALMLPLSLITLYAYGMAFMLVGCTIKTCVYP